MGITLESASDPVLQRATRGILAQYGNMSSPTVWFVLDEILQNGVAAGEWCVMVAFGAGQRAMPVC
jgi:predicted naringenin-chalcone synthase